MASTEGLNEGPSPRVTKVAEALDPSDRVQAILVWSSVFLGGPILTVAVLAVNWSNRESLARREALIATVMYAVLFVVYIPAVLWTFGYGGSMAVFMVCWAVVMLTTIGMSVAGLARSIRAAVPVPASPVPPPG
jgi:hypothetical protein